eukprot:TRINITY_DN5310_c0_g1_i1.p1 TRINITY_DN5310_c0_g1~~TRINITY_DN5310_c0_g1_i1.p1  ORF type:complete len:259 (+),score=38.16 TRINITY_DN5310_c0_g1_i1:63-839(+)
MDATDALPHAAGAEFSFLVSSFGGDQKTIAGVRCGAPLSDLIAAVSLAFELPEDQVKLLTATGTVLKRGQTLTELGLEDGSQLIMMRVESDVFDRSNCEDSMIISDDGKVVVKQYGGDLTCVKGKAIVAEGSRRWRVRVDREDGNLMIGVAHIDVPLSFSQDEWDLSGEGQRPTWPHVTRLAFVKTAGNTTPCWGVWYFGKGDVIAVDVDIDQGVVAFEKNGKTLHASSAYPWTGIQGPVTLFVSMDYHDDQVTILEE